MFDRLRIVVMGYIVRGPVGGRCWADLHYLLGLANLGHEVYFLEDSDDYHSCYDPIRNTFDTDPSYGLRFATQIFERFGLGNRWAYYDAHTTHWFGPCADRIFDICKSAELLLNLGGVNPIRAWLMDIPVRIFIDKDPVLTQIKIIKDPSRRDLALQHTAYFTLAENIGLGRWTLPDDRLPWKATRHPIFLDAWPMISEQPQRNFTTVMRWESCQSHEYRGINYGMKSDSFSLYLDLPKKAGHIFELAVAGTADQRALLASKGWSIIDPVETLGDPSAYQQYIQQSKAEFSLAKLGYSISRCGWFSERGASYLASGRPVLTQDTGFSEWLESGQGVIPFNSPEEVLDGIKEINSRYDHHRRAARAIAEEYFDSNKVLTRLIGDCIAFSS
ncbi:MAG TPA: hypothetical protein VFF49_07460 [Thermodesulfobacteriota bacterium]|nr:hypothetical protein [Thermodesulfobacteriota bacterium]